MKQRIAARLIRVARRLDPNSCVDFTPLPTHSVAVLRVSEAQQQLIRAQQDLAAYQ